MKEKRMVGGKEETKRLMTKINMLEIQLSSQGASEKRREQERIQEGLQELEHRKQITTRALGKRRIRYLGYLLTLGTMDQNHQKIIPEFALKTCLKCLEVS